MAIIHHRDAIHVYLAPDQPRPVSTNLRAVGAGVMDIRVVHRDTWCQHRQVIEAAAVDWQTLDALRVNDTRDRGVLRLQQGHSGVYFDCLLNRTNLQRKIDASLLAQLDHHTGPALSPEPRDADLYGVCTRNQVTNLIGAVWRGHRRVGKPSAWLGDGHRRSRNRTAAGIENGA